VGKTRQSWRPHGAGTSEKWAALQFRNTLVLLVVVVMVVMVVMVVVVW
jgi:hypothetical protein